MQNHNEEFRIGTDIGGTFTDIVFSGTNGTVYTKKIASTPDDYSRAVAQGIEEVLAETGLASGVIKEVVHGTTIVTNTCIELTGAKVGLITTKGFRDVLEIARGRMPQLYNLDWSKPTPLVPRHLRLEVSERIDKNGNILRPLQESEIPEILDAFRQEQVASVAICLYNSPRNPIHEERIEQILSKEAPDLFVSRSTKVRPMLKEYERTSETVVNAYVMPVVKNYLKSLKESLARVGVRVPVYVMQSSGGMILAEDAAEMPVEIVECGPAAGVVGAAYLAKQQNIDNLITLDLGGTTTKASVVESGKYTRSDEYEVGAGIHRASRLQKGTGYVLRIPSIDIAEIGAGGGSIVWIDKGGMVKVGPRSAGAVPGPACYSRGGVEPTLTDSYVLLGYMNPEYLLGGDFPLDYDKAFRAYEEKLAGRLEKSVIDTAFGAYIIANSNIQRAITSVSSERGRDPRKFSLIVFGGAGALHGAEVARGLGIGKVIVPPYGGIFSAFGLLCADVERNYVQAFDRIFNGDALRLANVAFEDMSEAAISSAVQHGYDRSVVKISRSGDFRYRRQSSDLTIPVPSEQLGQTELAKLHSDFNAAYEKQFGHHFTDRQLELVNLRISSAVRVAEPVVHGLDKKGSRKKIQTRSSRKAHFGPEHGSVEVPVLELGSIGRDLIEGPTFFDTYDTTIVVPPHCTAQMADNGNLIITIGE
jgi:N-methylhydantoinase A